MLCMLYGIDSLGVFWEKGEGSGDPLGANMTAWRILAAAALAATTATGAEAAASDKKVAGSAKYPELANKDDGFHKARPLTAFATVSKAEGEGEGDKVEISDNYYTSLEIKRSLTIAADVNNLPYTKRNLFWRLGIAKKYSFTVTLKADAANFSATVPLMTREYESSRRKGENFSRSIIYDNLGQPLFLVGSDPKASVANLRLSVNVSSDTSSDVMTRSLAVLTRAIRTISPTSAVLTSLSEEGNKNVAEAIDNAIGSIYSTSVKESIDFDISLKNGKMHKVEIFGPIYEVNETFHSVKLGEWTVAFSKGRPSIFSTKTDKTAAIGEARAKFANILAYELLNNLGSYGSVAGYLKQQEWWAADITKLATGNAATVASNQDSFCRKVRSAIGSLGLNDIDGRLVTEAIIHSDDIPSNATAGFDARPDCRVAS